MGARRQRVLRCLSLRRLPVGLRSQRGQSLVEFTLLLPIMLILLVAVADLARVYTTMVNVESAAREAADFGTTFGAAKWNAATQPMTVSQMQLRACIAASNLPDYDDPDADPATGCDNPSFDYCVTPNVGDPCGPLDPADGCDDPTRATPCTVTVTLTYEFHLFAPISIDAFGTRVGFPSTLTLTRDSTFAITDIEAS